MTTLLRSFALLAAIQWAATSINASFWLKRYFQAQLAYTAVLGVLLGVGASMNVYEAMFTVLTFCILVAAAGFVWECIREYEMRWILVIQALILPNMLIVGAHTGLKAELIEIPSYIWISLGESAALMTLGIILAPVALLTRRPLRVPAVVLSVLWLLLGAYEYGFTLLYPRYVVLLESLNEFVPALLVCAAFFTIGWRQRCIE